MTLTLGMSLFAAATLLFAGAVVVCRNPRTARWLRSDALASALTILCLALWTAGAGLLLKGSLSDVATAVVSPDMGGAVIVLAALIAGLRLLRPLRRLRDYAGVSRHGGPDTPDAPVGPVAAA